MDFDQQLTNIRQHATRLDQIAAGHRVVVEGHIFCGREMIWKQKNLYQMASSCKRILEIGFNAGHSAMIMLMANPKLELFCFDLGEHEYVDDCYIYLATTFGPRLRLIKGNSTTKLPEFVKDHPAIKFDGFHVDGCHLAEVARQDLVNCFSLAEDQAIVIFDDTDYPHLDAVWKEFVDGNKIVPVDLYSEHFFPTFKWHHAIGKYLLANANFINPKLKLDWHWYLNYYSDLTAAGFNTEAQAINHWITYGRKEGRAPNPSMLSN